MSEKVLRQRILGKLAKSCLTDNWKGFKETHHDDNIPDIVERAVGFALEEAGKEIDELLERASHCSMGKYNEGYCYSLNALKKRLS